MKKAYFKMSRVGKFMLFLKSPKHPLAAKMKPRYKDMDSFYESCIEELGGNIIP
jgi:hypothetical protein